MVATLPEPADEFEIVLRGIRRAASEDEDGTRGTGGEAGEAEVPGSSTSGEPKDRPELREMEPLDFLRLAISLMRSSFIEDTEDGTTAADDDDVLECLLGRPPVM